MGNFREYRRSGTGKWHCWEDCAHWPTGSGVCERLLNKAPQVDEICGRCLEKAREYWCGKYFIDWLNKEYCCEYVYEPQSGDRVPDLVYRFKHRIGSKVCDDWLSIEVTEAHYDVEGYKFERGKREIWFGSDPTLRLADCIVRRIQEKSKKSYGKQCLLLVDKPASAGATDKEELEAEIEELLLKKSVDTSKFVGVYVAGVFGARQDETTSYKLIPSRHEVIPIKPWIPPKLSLRRNIRRLHGKCSAYRDKWISSITSFFGRGRRKRLYDAEIKEGR